MKKIIHSGYVYNSFDRLIKRFEAWLTPRCRGRFGYVPEVVCSRITQQFVERIFYPYVADCASREQNDQNVLPDTDVPLTYGGLTIEQQSGKVSISPLCFLRWLFVFLLHWSHVLLHILPVVVRASQKPINSATLLIGVGIEGLFDKDTGEDGDFVTYCKSGPIVPLKQASQLMVHAPKSIVTGLKSPVIYTRYPLPALMRSSRLGMAARTKILLQHFKITFHFASALLANPLFVLLARDIAYLPMVRGLDSHGKIESVVITNSLHTNQPLWARESSQRGFKVHMVWYAQNVIPLVFRADGLVSDFPSYRHLRVDEHWVWTRHFADYLTEIKVGGNKHAVGPILWYLPAPRGTEIRPPQNEIRIAVFDVSPIREEVANKCGYLHNYYNADVLIKFINDVLLVADEIRRIKQQEVRILLKSKREYNQGHDKRYIGLLDSLAKDGAIEIVSHQINLYSFLQNCAASIVIPNSSPALVASHVNRKSIYYDPTASLVPNHETGEFMGSASDPESLLRLTLNAITFNLSQQS